MTEDSPAHAAGVVAQVVLDVVFYLEVADGRRVASVIRTTFAIVRMA